MSTVVDERVTDEIEALKAILLDDELNIVHNDRGELESIETIVFPSTGEDSQSQYVCVRLIVKLLQGYPDTTPIVYLRNPRGLDEETVNQIQSDVDTKCRDFVGQPVMFELIELVREHLTRSNLPTGQCAVCLYGFHEGDEFTKTECYHHFHSHCLAAHVAAAERYYREEQEKLPLWQQDTSNKFQALCPVCRESINCDVDSLVGAPPPIDVEAASGFAVSQDLLEMQHQMAKLFLRQQRRGGIIDLEAEGVKLLVMTEDDSNDTIEQSNPSESNAIASQSTSMDKPVIIPERPKIKSTPSVPEFVRNVMGSSAGAGSGEFHVYRHLRRKEYSRQKYIQEKGQRELLDKEYHERLEENKKLADATTAKKRAKRLKRKEKFKQKKFKINNSMNNQEENSDETDDNNQCSDDDKDEKLNVPHVEETINSNNKIEELNKENLKKNKAQIYIENMDKIGKNTNQSIDNVR